MHRPLILSLVVCACGPGPFVPTHPPRDAGVDAGADAGRPDAGGGDAGALDAGPAEPITTPVGTWTWVPVDGSECGAGARAGLGINRASGSDELFLFLQGGGACWNTGTCVPSFQQFGPLCDYGNICLLDAAGANQPTATHVTEPDPFPSDGGGWFPRELATIERSLALDRTRPENPFRDATFVYVPYCTGDLHAGAATKDYLYKPGAFDQPRTFTMHFSGAKNMDAYLARLKATLPDVKRIWLTGVSGGAFGATLNLDRVRRAFPNAEVHLLADSGPFVPTPHFDQWMSEWKLQTPVGCTDCDAGFPSIAAHLSTTWPDSRLALLSYDEDKVISWFFYAPPGAANFLNPPTQTFKTNLGALEDRADLTMNAKYFVVPGTEHVLFGDYGVTQADGGLSAPRRSRDGGTDLRAWINAWATGDAGWQSTR